MSVINQMLKDLDKRQEQEKLASAHQVPSKPTRNNTSIAIVSTAIATLILVALVYLFVENQALKESQTLKEKQTAYPISAQQKTNLSSLNATERSENNKAPNTDVDKNKTEDLADPETKRIVPAQADISSTEETVAPVLLTKTPTTGDTSSIESAKTISLASNEVEVTEQDIEQGVTQDNDRIQVNSLDGKKANSDTTSLNISRKKLTSEELAAKKMAQAEQAILDNNIQDAERLFEDILLLQPSHVAARKQLAALLYGRKATQPAINILAQGIALNTQDSDLRLMQARIYLDKGYQEQAFDTLNRLNHTMQVEYQSLLATVAQSLSRFEAAKNAYAKLIQLQGNQGRWYLGLAISHDSLAEYKEAYNAYESAMAIGGLSTSALDFAKQRKLELGE